MTDVRLREIPELLVLTEQRTIAAPDIKPWLMDAMDRLHRTTEEVGGRVDHCFVVYHGRFTEDTPEIPVEVCAPIGRDRAGTADVPMRVEPAHQEAYVRLRKSEFSDPAQVAGAFAAIAEWLARNGHTIADAPREVYFTDFTEAADTDEVCDIAFPIR
ncbi:GyrI-like domain-containing protein [Actinokineospora enzanensis]|uniref:GyrI-like domain-containing protein n=1 Tax=Actinokineospora enzanensis TaxID=155975 RepID=UPI0003691DCD|nr:GyrI-like domain-containing protein [Actinokineospora enzanensis]